MERKTERVSKGKREEKGKKIDMRRQSSSFYLRFLSSWQKMIGGGNFQDCLLATEEIRGRSLAKKVKSREKT